MANELKPDDSAELLDFFLNCVVEAKFRFEKKPNVVGRMTIKWDACFHGSSDFTEMMKRELRQSLAAHKDMLAQAIRSRTPSKATGADLSGAERKSNG